MSRSLFFALTGWCFFLLLINYPIYADDSTFVDYDTTIKISAEVNKKEVPLNDSLLLKVVLTWTGDIKRYQISELDPPIVENFEIISTAAADRRISERGIDKALKIYEFVLKPKSMGMGYIEGIMAKYIDNETGDGHSLLTSRLNVKITSPVARPGSKTWLLKWLLAAILAIGGIVLFALWQKKKREQRKRESEIVKVVPLEVEFLTNLRSNLNLNNSDVKVNQALWSISTILRNYISQKYQVPALESTTEKIVNELSALQLDQTFLNNIQEVLTVCDLAKFAGTETNRSELDRVYTLVEALLERNLGESKAENE
jgi:hypothetical protein